MISLCLSTPGTTFLKAQNNSQWLTMQHRLGYFTQVRESVVGSLGWTCMLHKIARTGVKQSRPFRPQVTECVQFQYWTLVFWWTQVSIHLLNIYTITLRDSGVKVAHLKPCNTCKARLRPANVHIYYWYIYT